MRKLFTLTFWMCFCLTLASFAGAWHGIGDSLAVFRYWWTLGLVLSALLLLKGHWRLFGLCCVALALAAAQFIPGASRSGNPGQHTYSIYQKNLRYNGSNRDGIVNDIRGVSPQFITLQEVSLANEILYETLALEYASHLLCPFSGVGGVAVLSKYPLVEGSQNCLNDQGLALMRVVTPAGPVWLASLHLHWPYPLRQPEQVNYLLSRMDFLQGPVILAGDFNMVPWSHTLREFEQITGSRRAGPVLQTLEHETYPLRLPIDHILVPGGQGQLTTRPKLGSDHFGLLLLFDL